MLTEQLSHLGLVMLAGFLGGVIGLEREFADKPAGLRTHIFVCAASAMLMLIGKSVLESFLQRSEGAIEGDPLRIIQAIVVGISFLGTGTIIHRHDNRVEGLTTASSILLTAGIGIAVSVDQLVFAIGITFMAVIVLVLVGWGERKVQQRQRRLKSSL
jgi:putative Mg2+ transporter-C (MgtC) family protein